MQKHEKVIALKKKKGGGGGGEASEIAVQKWREKKSETKLTASVPK